jgi:hypothetical protein
VGRLLAFPEHRVRGFCLEGTLGYFALEDFSKGPTLEGFAGFVAFAGGTLFAGFAAIVTGSDIVFCCCCLGTSGEFRTT